MEPDSRSPRFAAGGFGAGRSESGGRRAALERLDGPADGAADSQSMAPERYVVKEDDDGPYLTCIETPEVKVRIRRGFTVTANAAKKFPEGTIFLDGAAQAEPFLDLERRIYNLDHHQGCERRFTLAACEQAMVLVLRGLDLRERPWTIYANEPDLDTVLAIWVLLNSLHMTGDNESVKRAILPLVRLEGLIDVQGLEFLEFSGFPESHLRAAHRRLEALKEAAAAAVPDPAEVADADDQAAALRPTIAQLRLVDELAYPPGFFDELPGVEELARDEVTDNRIVVVVHSEHGIYEVERALKRLYGRRLGLIVLQKDPRTYTLRQVDSFLPVTLEAAYRRLNQVDPAVRGSRSANRWGGSGEIGGSPRSSGTDLSPEEIATACKSAYLRPPLLARLGAIGLAFLASGLTMAAGWFMENLGAAFPPWSRTHWQGSPLAFALGGLGAGGALLAVLATFQHRRLFGLQLPVGSSWIWTLPAVVAGALLGGAWLAPPDNVGAFRTDAAGLATLLLLPLVAEIAFRGVAHGLLLGSFSAQGSRGRWFLSWPAALSAVFYTVSTVPLWHPSLSSSMLLWPDLPAALPALGAMLLGAALGMCRERSGSLLATLSLHYVAVAAVVLVATLLG